MKDKTKIISLVLIALTIVCMFLPIATFQENSAGALSGEIAKQQDKVDRAQAKLDRDTKSGKDAEALVRGCVKVMEGVVERFEAEGETREQGTGNREQE